MGAFAKGGHGGLPLQSHINIYGGSPQQSKNESLLKISPYEDFHIKINLLLTAMGRPWF